MKTRGLWFLEVLHVAAVLGDEFLESHGLYEFKSVYQSISTVLLF